MKKITYLLIFLFIISLVSTIVIADNVKVGGYKITYDEIIEGDSDFDGVNDRTSYYLEDILVFSAYDTNGDGEQDMWFTYVNGTDNEVAMRDTTGDGKPENIVTFADGEIVSEVEKTNLPGLWMILGFLVIGAGTTYFILRKEPKKKRKSKK